ncbi:hypothetical protein N7489_007528 [Penicillium chrysogenum]|jgi:hypothetical protein|uniref:Uncharacterized protein n=1 Tax=Penicillium chrysogenum TaxID=5076 RepID=A0ABQ8W6R7_PENCH|nr:uncharacterized protein N7489_007528 [Penicillium chrysogenum]KAJ5237437.1 hypothetical protein N7489_007528 [Penicillium chrysogenum]KAJ5256375.1 hypothetical protein N7505_011526 [Penicillium chrysogenum]KAJ5277395.1 hypothetical protein N7524_003548 [Penicillium chrysogenum]KAJ6160231.1 hypothetical protein N7497_004768 [Penicillium chrysogenum]
MQQIAKVKESRRLPCCFEIQIPSRGVHASAVVELSEDMRRTITSGYDSDTRWKSLIDTLIDMDASQDAMKARLPYSLHDDGLLYFHPSTGEPSLCLKNRWQRTSSP